MAGADEELILMPNRNGVALLPGATRRLSLRSETITYELEDEDAEVVTLAGYKRGPGCPISVLIAVDDALAELAENEPTEDETPTFTDDGPPVPGSISIARYLAKAQYADRTHRRMMLQAVIPGLKEAQANVLASDDGPWKDMLIELGWRRPDDVPAESPAEDADEGEAAGPAASTGRPDSPASSPATPAETPST
jgi:hypothetical protein